MAYRLSTYLGLIVLLVLVALATVVACVVALV